LHHAMVQGQRAATGMAGGVGFEQVEFEHAAIVGVLSPQKTTRLISVASMDHHSCGETKRVATLGHSERAPNPGLARQGGP
jgi:hypothetical protein